MITEEEKNLFQLVLTQNEATLLGSVTTLGIRTFTGDAEAAAYTKNLLTVAVRSWPEATATLSKKMIALNEATMKCAKEESEGAMK
ncbi:hypothetical protein LCGC14_1906620 [marine sediment metagenome]|uniref:Uncharacterized protein n=1 Tax=marine sediment metagenome TaxID=412755 RepID=A0A0F9IT65_9ZZZZ